MQCVIMLYQMMRFVMTTISHFVNVHAICNHVVLDEDLVHEHISDTYNKTIIYLLLNADAYITLNP